MNRRMTINQLRRGPRTDSPSALGRTFGSQAMREPHFCGLAPPANSPLSQQPKESSPEGGSELAPYVCTPHPPQCPRELPSL